jgi:hypothetical protein
MRRAGQKGTASPHSGSRTPPSSANARSSRDPQRTNRGNANSVADSAASKSPKSPLAALLVEDSLQDRGEQLLMTIRKRIESRLGARVRNLVVRRVEDTVVLEGQCATFYTKQLAQHAALGVLEDEHLDNSIVVTVPR